MIAFKKTFGLFFILCITATHFNSLQAMDTSEDTLEATTVKSYTTLNTRRNGVSFSPFNQHNYSQNSTHPSIFFSDSNKEDLLNEPFTALENNSDDDSDKDEDGISAHQRTSSQLEKMMQEKKTKPEKRKRSHTISSSYYSSLGSQENIFEDDENEQETIKEYTTTELHLSFEENLEEVGSWASCNNQFIRKKLSCDTNEEFKNPSLSHEKDDEDTW